ncbi:MAG: hypothetical protein ICV64_08015 [Thermoleophilia bacterium]|nr:hypothetical protein [Thermoleophilia bacterium]
MSAQELIAALELEELSDEEHRIRSWRMEQFRSLGFHLVSAALLAESSVDLAVARRLAARGCPPELAARILL